MIGEIKIILGLFLILLFSAGDLKQVPKLAGLLGCITPVNGQFTIDGGNHKIFKHTYKITYIHNHCKIGYLYYEQFPLNLFVIHSFFITPKSRNQGHGLALLEFACCKLEKAGAKKIFIQPGPFEQSSYSTTKLMGVPEQEQAVRLAQIVRLYKKAGFVRVSQKLSFCAKYLYKIMGIYEDSDLLMVKNIKH
ncbi:MAG TPA: GNAT family N-acetyltransferase [Candidatus Babeliales bacterium]|nr:GNAT family N-acetyltransferase [Candidatus Babeliales bacterium]